MASYRVLQPGLLNVTRDDGQSFIAPMDEATAQAQGLTPEGAGPPPMPAPDMGTNPYSMASDPGALASNDWRDLPQWQGAPGAAPSVADVGPPPTPLPKELPPGNPAIEHRTPPAGAGGVTDLSTPWNPDEHPAAAVARQLIPVGGGEQASGEAPAGAGGDATDPAVLEAMRAAGMRSGGGARPAFHDKALEADITQSQAAQDEGASSLLEDQAAHKLTYLERQESLQQQAADAAAVAIQRRQAIDAEIASTRVKSEQAQQALMNAKPKTVDRYWGDMPVAAKIFTGIAVALGGFQAGSRGGRNTALDQVNLDIDRWVNDQRQQYETTKDKANLANNRYKDLLHEYGSPEQAQVQLQLQALAAKDALIKNQAEQMGTPDAVAAGQLQLQDSILQRKKLQLQAEQIAAAKAQQGGGGGGNPVLKALKAGAEATEALDKINHRDPKADKENEGVKIRLPEGGDAYVSKDQHKELAKEFDGRQEAIQKLEELHRIAATSGHDLANPWSKASTHYNSIASAVKTKMNVTAGQGSMSAGDDKNQANQVPLAGHPSLSDRAEALKAAIQYQKDALNLTLKNNAFTDPKLKTRISDPTPKTPTSFKADE